MEVAFMYLPHEVPFVLQIFNVYSQMQTVYKQTIHEDNDQIERVKFLRPMKGGATSNYLIPLIRRPGNSIILSLILPSF